MSGRGRQATSLHRPIQLLYPLEVSQSSLGAHYSVDASQQPATSTDPMDSEDDTSPDKTESAAPRRSRRAAAQEARDRMMAQALDEIDFVSVDHLRDQQRRML